MELTLTAKCRLNLLPAPPSIQIPVVSVGPRVYFISLRYELSFESFVNFDIAMIRVCVIQLLSAFSVMILIFRCAITESGLPLVLSATHTNPKR